MRKIYFFLAMVFVVNGVWGQKTWLGTAGDGLWNTASNWSGGTVPISTDNVLLDNSTVAGSFAVTLPTGAVTVAINRLTITPTVGNTITVTLPSGNTANPGFNVGDVTAATDDIIVNNGGILINSSGAAAGNGIQANSTANATVRINNGGKYIHNSARSTAGTVPLLSTAVGTETGIYEYDSPGTGSVAISASGRNYGSLVLTRTAGAATYSSAGGSALTIRGNFLMNAGITYNSTMTGAMNVASDFTNNGVALTLPAVQVLSFNGSGNQTISGSAAITFGEGAIVTSTSTTILARSISIPTTKTLIVNGTLDCGTNAVTGAGAFTLSAAGYLKIGSDNGITSTPATGNIQVLGTRTFNTGANYTYNGGAAQVTGDQLPATVNNLSISNSGGVTLTSGTTVNGTLTLTGGILTIDANNFTVIGNISGGSSTSYIKTNSTGSFTLNSIGAGPVLIPVGNSTYNSLSFTNGSSLNWTIRVEDAVNNVVLPFTTDKAISRTWHISPSAPVVTGPDVTFNFDDADVSQLVNPAAYSGDVIRTALVWHYTGTQWLAATGFLTMTALEGPQSLTLSGYTYYSPFAISKSSGPLPVKFANVKAYQQGSSIKIDWSNLTESNVVNYVVERSANGSIFTALNTIGAARNDGGRSDYTSLDISPLNGVNFYRIRSNELDGKLLYSVIVKVNTKGGVAGITVYPNPVTSGQVSLQTTGFSKGLYTVRIFDAAGQQVYNQLMNHNGGAATEVIQLPASLKPGMYNLQLSGEDVKLAKPFIIK